MTDHELRIWWQICNKSYVHNFHFLFQATVKGSSVGWRVGKDGFSQRCVCAEDNDCNCPYTVTRRLNGKEITTGIEIKPACSSCSKGSCCDMFSYTFGRNQKTTPVHIQMKPGCTECKGSCCDDVLASEPDQTNAMITYL